jgi:DNA-binding MarR family transcriptional regulator
MTTPDADPQGDAGRIAEQLAAIRKLLRRPITHSSPIPLTHPQLQALEVIVDHLRAEGTGPSLSQLSERMGLAHSTVSAIVTRLEGHGLLLRTPAADDRRYTRIELTKPVHDWIERDLPQARLEPLTTALREATDKERAQILTGLATLRRLLNDQSRPG